MASGKAIYKQREIVLTRFPFSNLIESKVRPVLILSKDSYNCQYGDVIVCAITSNLEESEYGITISSESLEEGHLKITSKIRGDAITSIDRSIIIKQIGTLKAQVFKEVLEKVNALFA